jgi:beta-glucanase (GH16 family)
MKTTILALLLASSIAYGQSFPGDVTFSGSQQVCDSRAWRLVLYDEFNGSSLGAPWITFNSYAGMTGGDHDNWKEGRWNFGTISRDENVVVGGGMVKLQVKRQTSSWACDTCSDSVRYYSKYTTGALRLPYTGRNFNSGKFEARIQMPDFWKAHATFWTWFGSCVNEIDIAECYGKHGLSGMGNFPYVEYNTHVWAPDSTGGGRCPNPDGLTTQNAGASYAGQTWMDHLCGRRFRPEEFHTYGCEWDSAVVRFYVDGNLENSYWKYYIPGTRGYVSWGGYFPGTPTRYSGCVPPTGTWKVCPIFPYKNPSWSTLNFTPYLDDKEAFLLSPSGTLLGSMNIDWAKIWLHELENGWTDLCNLPDISINGPTVVCPGETVTFTVSTAIPGGYWASCDPDLECISETPMSKTVKIRTTAKTGYKTSNVAYIANYGSACSGSAASIRIASSSYWVGKPTDVKVVVSQTHNMLRGTMWYNLSATAGASVATHGRDYTDATFEWYVYYGPGLSLFHYDEGKSIVVPAFVYDSGMNTIQYTVVARNRCGYEEKSGEQKFYMRKLVIDRGTTTFGTSDIAVVTKLTDEKAYEDALERRISRLPFTMATTATEIKQAIAHVQIEELQPWVVFDSITLSQMDTNGQKPAHHELHTPTSTTVYPNPTKGMVNIVLSKEYAPVQPVHIKVQDLYGQLKWQNELTVDPSEPTTIDLADFVPGLYFLTIKQNGMIEHLNVSRQ